MELKEDDIGGLFSHSINDPVPIWQMSEWSDEGLKEDRCSWMSLSGQMRGKNMVCDWIKSMAISVSNIILVKQYFWWAMTQKSSLPLCSLAGSSKLQQSYPLVSPCRCLHLSSSPCSGWPHSAPLKSQASSSTSSLLSHWPSSGLHFRRGDDTVHLHNSKDHISHCAAVCTSHKVCDTVCPAVCAMLSILSVHPSSSPSISTS